MAISYWERKSKRTLQTDWMLRRYTNDAAARAKSLTSAAALLSPEIVEAIVAALTSRIA